MKNDKQISDVALPVAETADLMVKAAKDGIDFAEYLGIHVLRSAYGVLHPSVVADRNRAKAGINGPETPELPK
jgi:hypothetical protein